jgi:acyl-coenzyme A thioesterase PaaI-like protein
MQYLRSGKPHDTYARAVINRAGRRIASVTVEAWQEARDSPIAFLHGHFLVAPAEPA